MPKPHSWEVAESGFEPRLFGFLITVLCLLPAHSPYHITLFIFFLVLTHTQFVDVYVAYLHPLVGKLLFDNTNYVSCLLV